MQRSLVRGLAALLACTAAAPLFAAISCSASAGSVAFGTYNPTNPTSLASTGTITLTCTALLSLSDTWTIALGAGNGSYAARQLKNGAAALGYNLYTAASHAVIWGDGSAGTGTVSDTHTLLLGTNSYNYTVYGQINSLQDKPVGTYTDSIAVTINY